MATRRLLPTAVVAGVLGLVLIGLLGYRVLAQGHAGRLQVFGEAPSFALIDQLERPVSSGDFRGRVVVANFIYTSCPDICPLLSVRMQALQGRLQAAGLIGGQVQLLSFSVDPARDTPAVLREYAERHQADPGAWRFLTGPEQQVVPLIVDGFHLGVQALPPKQENPSVAGASGEHHKPYEVMHSGRFVVIDRQWRIRAYYDGAALDLDRVMRDVRQMLKAA